MDDHPLGLIHDDDIIIFIHNVKGYLFRCQVNFLGCLGFNYDLVPDRQFILRLDRLTINADVSVHNPLLQVGTGKLIKLVSEDLINPPRQRIIYC